MKWFFNFLGTSLGKKYVMSLTGLFLIIFLIVHLVGNLQLLLDDNGEKFNLYTKFMTSNPLIKTISYGLYFFILLHATQGIRLWLQNLKARKHRYAVKSRSTTTFASRTMGVLGTIVLLFLIIHLWRFWFQMKIGAVEMVNYGEHEPVLNLYAVVALAFRTWWYVLLYVICMVVLGYHLYHGFQSSF